MALPHAGGFGTDTSIGENLDVAHRKGASL